MRSLIHQPRHNPLVKAPATPEAQAARERLQRLSYWLDRGLRLPGTGVRFGLEPLIGMIPVVGDAAGLLLSGWLIVEARRAGAPPPLLLRMTGNALLDAGAGALPLVGDLFDFFFQANTRNAELLRGYLEPEAPVKAAPRSRLPRLALLLCAVGAVFLWWFFMRR